MEIALDEVVTRLGMAFENETHHRLNHHEVAAVYLSLLRLAELERMAEAGDWEGIKAYTPIDPDHRP